MEARKFKCNYCGKEYEKIINRAECEIKCDSKTQEKIKEEKQKKLQADEDSRVKAIQNTYDLLVKQMVDFKNDYHKVIRIQNNSSEVFPSLLNMFDLLRF